MLLSFSSRRSSTKMSGTGNFTLSISMSISLRRVVAYSLGQIIIQGRNHLMLEGLHFHPEFHRLAGQLLQREIPRVRHFELTRITGLDAAQVLIEFRKRCFFT